MQRASSTNGKQLYQYWSMKWIQNQFNTSKIRLWKLLTRNFLLYVGNANLFLHKRWEI